MRKRFKQIIVAVTALALAATLASVLPWRFWPLELAASFRVQTVTVGAVAAAAAVLLRMRIWATVGAAAAIAQIALLVPHFVSAGWDGPRADETLRPGRELTVLTVNLNHANRRDAEVIEAIRREKPDIVALQEASPWWHDRFRPLLGEYPYQTFDGITERSGVGVLSRFAPEVEEWRVFDERAFVRLLFERDGPAFRFVSLHTYPPKTPGGYTLRNRQLERTAEWIAEGWDGPVIVAGDMNTTPWSPVMRDFESTTGIAGVREGRGAIPTWPAWGILIGVPIDHIHHSPHFRCEHVRPVEIPGSDHRALLARLRVGANGMKRDPASSSLL